MQTCKPSHSSLPEVRFFCSFCICMLQSTYTPSMQAYVCILSSAFTTWHINTQHRLHFYWKGNYWLLFFQLKYLCLFKHKARWEIVTFIPSIASSIKHLINLKVARYFSIYSLKNRRKVTGETLTYADSNTNKSSSLDSLESLLYVSKSKRGSCSCKLACSQGWDM